MNCGTNFVKYLLFIFNFFFTLCGLAILIVGVLIHLQVKEVARILEDNVAFPSIALIVVGAIIFTVAFFGCCGAIRESHCMMVTFAMLLLTILVIQVAIAIFAFVKLRGIGDEAIRDPYTDMFKNYWTNENDREIIDSIQSNLECCGINSYDDYGATGLNNKNGTIPWSCCNQVNEKERTSCTSGQAYGNGCVKVILHYLEYAGVLLGGVAIGIAVIEFVGIIFALCLANSIRNTERRGYRV